MEPDKTRRALLFARACGLVPRRAWSLAGCHRAAGACQGAAHVRDVCSRRRAIYLKVGCRTNQEPDTVLLLLVPLQEPCP
jgi:hypothetical protein